MRTLLLLTFVLACGSPEETEFERRMKERRERLAQQGPQPPRQRLEIPPPQEIRTFEAIPVTLNLPNRTPAEAYERVRANEYLGPAFDKELVPALSRPDPSRYRLADFEAKRKDAVRRFTNAVGMPNDAVPVGGLSEELAVIDDFDLVCTDALMTWFEIYTEAASKVESRAAAVEELRELEGLSLYAFPWHPDKGKEAQALVAGAIARLEAPDLPTPTP